MSRLFPAWFLLAGCGGPGAEVTGTVLEASFSDTDYVYFGEPYIVISEVQVDCDELSWVRRNYEEGVAPTESDAQMLQFAFADDDDAETPNIVKEGRFPIDVAASVEATVVLVSGAAMATGSPARATGGVLEITVAEDESTVEGSFETVTFDTGTLSGTFTAEWCRNLKG